MSGANGWESVYTSENDRMERLPVEGGWLYRNFVRSGSDHGGYTWMVALSFATPITELEANIGFDAGAPAP